MTESPTQTKEFKSIRKEMGIVVKENQKLQSELKIKNETINALISQNFDELRSLQNKHADIVKELGTNYESHIGELNKQYQVLRKSFYRKLKDNLGIHYKISSERIAFLTKKNTELVSELAETRRTLESIRTGIQELSDQNALLLRTQTTIESTLIRIQTEYDLVSKQLAEARNTNLEYEKIISTTKIQNEKLAADLSQAYIDMQTNSGLVKKLSSDIAIVEQTNNEIRNQYTSLLADNLVKQNSLEEKLLELASIAAKQVDIEKKNASLEATKQTLESQVSGLLEQLSSLKLERIVCQQSISQLKAELHMAVEQKDYYELEATTKKTAYQKLQSGVLNQISLAQKEAAREKELYVSECENKLSQQKKQIDDQLSQLQQECTTSLVDRDKKLENLSNHIKSFMEFQYVTIQENEKLKSMNEKLRTDQSNIDRKISDIQTQCNNELVSLNESHQKEKEMLTDSYNETIKKSQEMNDAIQNRLNQTIEAISLSKTAIASLKEMIQSLEKQLRDKELDTNSSQEQFDSLRMENLSIKDKLDRSIELNNMFSTKEKQYESQIKQLQMKYSQLISLAKKSSAYTTNPH